MLISREKNYRELSKEIRSIRVHELKTSDDFYLDGYEEILNELTCCVRARYVCGKENRSSLVTEFFKNC